MSGLQHVPTRHLVEAARRLTVLGAHMTMRVPEPGSQGFLRVTSTEVAIELADRLEMLQAQLREFAELVVHTDPRGPDYIGVHVKACQIAHELRKVRS